MSNKNNNMKTAREFAIDNFMEVESGFSFELGGLHKVDQQQVIRVMIEFAQMHVKAALREASEQVYHDIDIDWVDPYDYSAGFHGLKGDIDKDSILNAYPLTNIK